VFEFIEGWCNHHRRHSALGYESPAAYEWRHAMSLSAPDAQEELVPVEVGPVGEQVNPG